MSRGISIHAPRTGSDGAEHYQRHPDRAISIHAPRTGSDAWHLRGKQMKANFNPRSPHGERLRVFGFRAARDDFNPRSPHGERLHPAKPWKTDNQFQSTLPARGATRCSGCRRRWRIFQSTLPARGATIPVYNARREAVFQSTLPARGATQRRLACGLTLEISIHAPRTGSDRWDRPKTSGKGISIHAPRTGSDVTTRLSRSAGCCISIHAPRTGSDLRRL